MIKKYLTQTVQAFYESHNKQTVLESENAIVGMLGAIIMIIGSVFSFVSLRYVMHIKSVDIVYDSIFMFAMGFIVFGITFIKKRQDSKVYVLSLIFSFYLVLVTFAYYRYIGPTVWTVAATLMLVSLMYSNSRIMLISIIITVTGLAGHIIFSSITFDYWEIFYQAQTVMFLIFSLLVGTIHNILKKKSAMLKTQFDQINRTEQKLTATLRSVGDGVLSIDKQGKIEFINTIAQELTGWFGDEAIGISYDKVFDIVNENTKEKVDDPVKKVFETGKIIELANHALLKARDGQERSIENTAAPIVNDDGKIIGCVLVFRDFSDKRERQRQIEYLSFHDQLTGLYNRRYLEESLTRLDTKTQYPLSIIYADVNGLKMINDAFGHEFGDQLLLLIAEVMREVFREDDVIARVGGDEFMVLLPKTNKYTVDMIVKDLKGKIDQLTVKNMNVSVSFGWDTKDDECKFLTEVINSAEEFMYQKKILNSTSKRSGIVMSILDTLLVKFPNEEAHSIRVSKICEEIGRAYDLTNAEIKELSILGRLHDIGKIAVDESILRSSNKLSDAEWDQIKQHSEIGYRLLGATVEFNMLANDVLQHHEKWDGTGYPRGLKGEDISWKARVVSLADAYDAMISERAYKDSMSHEDAIAEIKRCMGNQFDPKIAQVFIEKVADKFISNESIESY